MAKSSLRKHTFNSMMMFGDVGDDDDDAIHTYHDSCHGNGGYDAYANNRHLLLTLANVDGARCC